MRCAACNAELSVAPGDRVGFREECDHCGADLHICRNCTHHDPSAYNECREPNSERVSDRDRANRCDYFSPSDGAGGGTGTGGTDALSALDALFSKPESKS